MYLGNFDIDDNEKEKCLMVYFKAPFSYTGEDIVEFQLHGGTFVTQKMLERILRESLTPTQYGIYKACILNGISYKAYADQMGVSYQSVQNAIRLIQKKAKNIFG